MSTPLSPYMLIFRDASASYHTMSSEQRQQLLQQWNEWYDRLTAQGRLQQGHPLEPKGRVVSMSGDRVVDGPFTESKEAIGGYFLIMVADMDEALEIARQCPSLRLGLTVEVRPAAEICPSLRTPQPAAKELVPA